jgi:hypothetical protein
VTESAKCSQCGELVDVPVSLAPGMYLGVCGGCGGTARVQVCVHTSGAASLTAPRWVLGDAVMGLSQAASDQRDWVRGAVEAIGEWPSRTARSELRAELAHGVRAAAVVHDLMSAVEAVDR